MTSQPDETIRKLNALTQVLGVDAGVLASALGVQKGTLQAWLDGSRKPGKAAQPRVNEVFGQMTRGDGGHDRLRTILALLEASYGTLRLEAQEDPLDELFLLLLSLKTTYRTFEEIFRLFRGQFHPWDKLLEAGRDEIESCVRKGGLGSIKATAFVDIARRLKAANHSVAVLHANRSQGIELAAAVFIGIVALDVFVTVMLRYFGIAIPDSYDFGQLLLGRFLQLQDLLLACGFGLAQRAHVGLGQRHLLHRRVAGALVVALVRRVLAARVALLVRQVVAALVEGTEIDHLVEGVTLGGASAVLAASIFHFGDHTIAEAKAHMAAAGIPMRLS